MAAGLPVGADAAAQPDGILLCPFPHMLVHNYGWQILRPMPSRSLALTELLPSRLVV
ncbi:hypothetical protein [Frigoribacterium sp. CG_9.8]|uniref:hypothetical protein n=1 Tax=Frigoribacterium sp. CG_9.8 TaxID=2787733 RepID=UPI0018C989D6|nr:hypothetical protein [Frigoribacterium sp. CG_9.8]MBG6107239.1 hypothetical protein [Frigoribacterium sp. CG_9.8]